MDSLPALVPYFAVVHILAVISWMAGLLYLPRLFVYHTEISPGTEEYQRFCTMERRLLRGIMNPAMLVTFLFGGLLAAGTGYWQPEAGVWLHIKIVLVLVLAGLHGMMARYRKDFLNGGNRHTAKYYKWFNEMPALLMVGIVALVVLKPF